jgi:hypothetical protein
MVAVSQYSSETSCDRPTLSGFPPFFSVLEEMLSWCPKSMLHCVLLMRPSQLKNFRQNAAVPTFSKFRHDAVLQTQHSAHTLKFFRVLHAATSHFPTLYLAFGLPLPEERGRKI